ncbi:MAG: metallophosphoesterase [Planctomycetales bacterium]|nr:metallophosphoesterase [Planctomycetales bacterium]
MLLTYFVLRGLTASADEFSVAPPGTFSVAVIPDTQQYRGGSSKSEPQSTAPVTNAVFAAYVDWIVDNLDRQRIVFVSHVGDIVDINRSDQWGVAREMMDRLHGRVPYGISVGNHDMNSAGDSSLFQQYFPASRFESFPWYGGCFTPADRPPGTSGNNANSFQLVTAAGIDLLFLHLECNAPDDVLAWADGVLAGHGDRLAIVTSHMGLGPRDRPQQASDYFDAPKGRMTWKKCHAERGNTPEQMWQKCFRKHPNLVMTCCGDQSRSQALHQTSRGDGGNAVHELLSDYGSNGLRVMRFVPDEGRIEVRTWNPLEDHFCRETKIVPDESQHQFELELTVLQPQP